MSALKDQDPDYGPSDARNEKHQRSFEENARNSTARKITTIIEKEFSEEIDTKEKEILEIQERLHRASKVLHLLRYVIVADFYNRKQCQSSQNGDTKQTQIHPAIKQLIGKAPRLCDNFVGSNTCINNDSYTSVLHPISFPFNAGDSTIVKSEHNEDIPEPGRSEKRSNDLDADTVARPKKIPRYIPPRSGLPEPQCPSRGVRHKVRKRVIIGNISKWIPPEWREDAAGHKWTMYVRGNKENPDIDDFVSKVRFFLHPSYRPNDVVEVTSAPFCLSRRGWGEFPLRVQLHFKSALNKPMDIIHHLKLDRTYTGLQTLGSETLVDIWIYADSRCSNRNVGKVVDQDTKEAEHDSKIKQENNEDSNLTSDFTNNSLNAAFNSIDKVSDTLIKQEPVNDINIKPSDRNSRNLLLSVELDHDYCGSKFLNGLGGNLTIDHTNSSTEQIFADESNDVARSDHRSSDNLRLNVEVANANKSTLNNVDRSTSKVLPLSCSKIHSNLCPLEITIPPLFEPSRNRHVLVLDNNETIPVDIAVPRPDDHIRNLNNDPAKSKSHPIASRGISLLRKPPGSSEVTIQVGNSKEGSAQQTLKVQLSKSVLLNVNSDVPVLKIAETRISYDDRASISEKDVAAEVQASRENNRQSKEQKSLRQKITVGKDKHKLQSKKEFYDEVIRAIVAAEIASVEGLLKFIIRRMPIISTNASDPDYRRLHPYVCKSEEEFFTYNVAKRNACEWSRAKMIRCFMKKKFLPEEMWTTKEIMIWARMHGYTPLCADFSMRSMKQQKSLADSTIVKRISTYTEPDSFYKWLENYPSRPNEQLFDFNSSESKESEADVDVVSVAPQKEGKRLNGEEKEECTNSKITVLELDNKLVPLHDFVCETARAIGIKLVSEEVLPNIAHCAAGRMVMRAVECLVEDLVRISLARAWERCSDNGGPKVILLDDVRGALLNREEFDVFTNRGLGSKYRFMATE